MDFDIRSPRVAARALLGLVLTGTATAAGLAATHPASAAAALAAVESTVTCATTAACVNGNNTAAGPGVAGSSAKGIAITATGVSGVRGYATTGYGVKGASNSFYGLQGQSTTSYGIYGSSINGQAGVVGTTPSKYGLFGYTSSGGGGTGVYGSSVDGYGVWGTTTNGAGYGVVGSLSGSGTGVYGGSNSGYAVYGSSDSGSGVYGVSSTGTGVTGSSGSSYGVSARTSGGGSAVYAQANGTGYGVIAYSNSNPAMYGRNSNGNGADFGGSYIGVLGRAPVSGGYPLVLTDPAGNNVFYVNGVGDVSYKGGLFAFTRTRGGLTAKTFSPKAALPTVEDTGTANLVAGAAVVRLEPTFASTIDPRVMYRVFLTPNGDTRGLFVAAKTADGFIVRETQGGHATLSFDYRIVATPLGQAEARMAVMAPGADAAPHALPPVAPMIKTAEPEVIRNPSSSHVRK